MFDSISITAILKAAGTFVAWMIPAILLILAVRRAFK